MQWLPKEILSNSKFSEAYQVSRSLKFELVIIQPLAN